MAYFSQWGGGFHALPRRGGRSGSKKRLASTHRLINQSLEKVLPFHSKITAVTRQQQGCVAIFPHRAKHGPQKLHPNCSVQFLNRYKTQRGVCAVQIYGLHRRRACCRRLGGRIKKCGLKALLFFVSGEIRGPTKANGIVRNGRVCRHRFKDFFATPAAHPRGTTAPAATRAGPLVS